MGRPPIPAIDPHHPDTRARCKAIKSELKAIGVVCFGYFRYRNARYGCAEVHQAIQALGRTGMTRAREVAQQHGFQVVHTMTDCAFMQKPGATKTDVRRVARSITKEVGVPMDVEGIYDWVVFLPSKTHSTSSIVGVPNRYYGRFRDGTLKVRGIEVQRHSTPPWIYDVQQGMLDLFQQARTAAEFKASIPAALAVAKAAAEDLRQGKVPLVDLGTMVQARMAVEDYTANTTTKAALRRLREAGTERRPGEYIKYVITRRQGPADARATPVELIHEPGRFEGDLRPHVPSYARLLARSVETLLSPFGYTEDALYAWFMGRRQDPLAHDAMLDIDDHPTYV